MTHSPHSQFTLGVAVFVKTPGMSPLKTRLAKTVGLDAAHDFYRYACKAIAQTLQQARKESDGAVHPVWAVAEDDADRHWPEFTIVHQGPGGLGDKLHYVYGNLLKRFSSVALIGADAPQITVSDLLLTRDRLRADQDFVVGPASDGGFYLFAGKKPVSEQVWLKTPYSQANTLEKLLIEISKSGSVSTLNRYTDVDTFEDLKEFLTELKSGQNMTREQSDLVNLCTTLIANKNYS